MKYHSACVSLTIAMSALVACTKNPASPSLPPAVPPSYTVSGVISATTPAGVTPVEGAVVGAAAGRMTTDKDGFYTLSGVRVGDSVSVSKSGYQPIAKTLTIGGDTRLDFTIVELPYYTLSGVVFERTPMGTAPIEGVEVYCDSCGSPVGHTFTYTDASGFYSFSYTNPGFHSLLIRKDGYGDPPGQPPGSAQGYLTRYPPMVNGDTKFDIELARR